MRGSHYTYVVFLLYIAGSRDERQKNSDFNMCTECDKVCWTFEDYRRHLAMVHNMLRFECFKCNEVFASSEIVTTHARSRHFTSKCTCSVCHKQFSSESALERHVSIHKSKPFLCSKCGAGLASKFYMTIHMKRCQKVKNQKCKVCPSAFVTKFELNRHTHYKHKLVKRIQCSQCAKTYESKENLRHHMNEDHEWRKPWQCPRCDTKIRKRQTFLNHLQKVHGLPRKLPPKD